MHFFFYTLHIYIYIFQREREKRSVGDSHGRMMEWQAHRNRACLAFSLALSLVSLWLSSTLSLSIYLALRACFFYSVLTKGAPTGYTWRQYIRMRVQQHIYLYLLCFFTARSGAFSSLKQISLLSFALLQYIRRHPCPLYLFIRLFFRWVALVQFPEQ